MNWLHSYPPLVQWPLYFVVFGNIVGSLSQVSDFVSESQTAVIRTDSWRCIAIAISTVNERKGLFWSTMSKPG
jgi:hypothetical protein